ncbi:hypothetical protein [Bacteriovorax sp. Seq25_V]|uniref:hypothetical protein n=1 Tax=Bacteriovorax sp. Seq25_V TaxID=1201288 RepID=UPI00038A53BC|nr:hypothetical protein [Bacteriovorax sp. Seq25_V]EQC46684.1 hypothetical protein M900_2450 [Bacteriovorax sp. Seq25_V]
MKFTLALVALVVSLLCSYHTATPKKALFGINKSSPIDDHGPTKPPPKGGKKG